MKMHKFFISFTVLISLVLGGFLLYAHSFLGAEQWQELSAEDGGFEFATAITFGVAALAALIVFLKRRVAIWAYFSTLMTLACMRELDLHKEWTTDSILKSNFYLKEGAPLHEKIIGAAIIILLLVLAYKMARRIPRWIVSLWNFNAQAWAVGFGLGSLAVAKSLDSMARWFPFLADFKAENGAFLGVIEESLEMTGAFFFLSVCLMALRLKR